MPASIAENLASVRHRMAEAERRSGRPAGAVALVAVSKTQPPPAVREAMAAGQRVFGENRVQEALAKIEAVGAGAEWHLIGHLQTNKAKLVPGRFQAVQTVDSVKLARALGEQAAAQGAALDVMLQLNWTREASKSGIQEWGALREVLECLRGTPALRCTGLMTIPDPAYDERRTREHFALVRELLERLRREAEAGPAFKDLSMGMSHDFEWAIEEGATIVRIGTAIFGARR